MLKKISAMKVRQNLGQIMNEVALRGDDYVIERAGKPLVAMISMEKFQILQRERDTAVQALEQIWGKMKDEKPESIDAVINEAVKTMRSI